jgi:hypothetical protein
VTIRDRLYAVLVVGGVVAVALLLVLIFRFGRHDPSPPSLRSNPNPSISGVIVYFDRDGCIIRVDASGATRQELYCEGTQGPRIVSWVDAKTVAFARFVAPAAVWVLVDVETRQATQTGGIAGQYKGFPGPGSAVSPSGDTISVDQRDGKVFLVAGGVRTQIADFDVREYGGPNVLTWSPDGQWILLQYYPPRSDDGRSELWILSRDGVIKGTLATDAFGTAASWWIEGQGFLPAVDGLPPK